MTKMVKGPKSPHSARQVKKKSRRSKSPELSGGIAAASPQPDAVATFTHPIHNPQLPPQQRQTLALRLGQTQGNRYLQRLLHSEAQPELKMGLSPHAAAPTIQRGGGDEETTGPTVKMGDYEITTRGGGSAAGGYFALVLEEAIKDMPEGAYPLEAAKLVIEEGRGWRDMLKGRSDDPLDQATADNLKEWYREYEAAAKTVYSYQRREVAEKFEAAQEDLEAQKEKLDEVQPDLDELLRAAFLSEDDALLKKVGDTAATYLDTGLNLHTLAKQFAKEARTIRGGTGPLPEVSKYTHLLDKLNKIYAAYTYVQFILSGESVTELATALKTVGSIGTLASAGSTLLGLSAHFGLYAGLYLAPMASAAASAASKLIHAHNHELNMFSLQTGSSAIDWSVEPGGEPMYRFMTTVMQAGDSSGVPDPIPETIIEYFDDHQDKLEMGTQKTMPTEGWIFKDIDPIKVRRWVYSNRRTLWSMFYGKLPPP
ncbi:MAG: hypothetical protein KA314_29240 [Chloroflexi bacterium]|nr:hypothetical protein [Chloroflexota bacterium]MBP8059944.1 hypothetical protein [Chloroflexota bacterium]